MCLLKGILKHYRGVLAVVLEYEKIKVGNKNITLKVVHEINGGSIDDNCKVIMNKLSKLRVIGIRKIDLIKNTNIIKIECFFNVYFVKVKSKEVCIGFDFKKLWLIIILNLSSFLISALCYFMLSMLLGVIVGGIFAVLLWLACLFCASYIPNLEVANVSKSIYDCFKNK